MDTLKPLYFYLDKVETNARLNWWRRGNRHWRPDLVQWLDLYLQPLCGCHPLLLRLRCYCVYGHCSNFDRYLGWDSSGNRRCHFDVSRWGDREYKLRKKMKAGAHFKSSRNQQKTSMFVKSSVWEWFDFVLWKCKKVKNMILFVVGEFASSWIFTRFSRFQ